MGSYLSTAPPSGSSPSKPSPVLSFHSSAQWKSHFDSVKETDKLMVIDFSATWCGPCRHMEPFLNDLAIKHSDVVFVKIDVDELKDVAREWRVEAMPTFVLVKQGREVDRIVGARKDELQKKVESHKTR